VEQTQPGKRTVCILKKYDIDIIYNSIGEPRIVYVVLFFMGVSFKSWLQVGNSA